METNQHIPTAYAALKYSYGAVILLAGLDKVFGTNLITQWAQYISPFVAQMLPVSVSLFLITIGVVEVVVAVLLFTRFTRIAAYISVAWLLLISVNLVMGGFIDVAIRDVLLAVGAFALAQLDIAKKE